MRRGKRNNLVLIITVIFVGAIGLVFFKYKLATNYVKVNKAFENSLVTIDKASISKTINIEVTAKISKDSVSNGCNNRKDITGTILIDNIKYELSGLKCCKSNNNTFICTVNEDKDCFKQKYVCYISEDFSSIILEAPTRLESIVAPANNIDEALSLKCKLLGKK